MFGILGPLEIRRDGRQVEPGTKRQRLVLALLLCEAGASVPTELLIEALWPQERPGNPRKAVQVYVSNLRAVLAAAGGTPRISSGSCGYRIELDPGELDALRFEQSARSGSRLITAGRTAEGAAMLRQALDLWRGPVLREFEQVEAVRRTAQRLTQLRLSAVEQWGEAELALGRPEAALDALEPYVLEHPVRERLRALQMTALHRLGQPAEAQAVYDETRQILARDFGLGPGSALRDAHRELIADGARRLPARAARPAERGPVVLPHDLADFTGREALTDAALQALNRDGAPRRVVLTGQVGAGKTALAVRVAHAARQQFPDGCVLVRLRNVDGLPRPLASVLTELWQIARVPGAMPEDIDAASGLWQAHAATRRLLLVLDDARDEAVVRWLVPDAGDSAALLTSRTRLAAVPGAVRLTVPALPRDQALELLSRVLDREGTAGAEGTAAVEGAGAADPDGPAARRIVDATGCLPLGVRAAGDRINGLRRVSVSDYARRLDDCGQRLDQLTVGTVPVRARLDAALADLPTRARAALHRLSALPLGPFGPGAAAAALGVTAERAEETLDLLHEHGALVPRLLDRDPVGARPEIPLLLQLRLRETPPPIRASVVGSGHSPRPARRTGLGLRPTVLVREIGLLAPGLDHHPLR